MIMHEFDPVYNKESKILILGTFPSVKSRENGFYYGHPQNRFWFVLAEICQEKMPLTIEEKTEFLVKHKIAVWDVIKSCDIIGSSDTSIKNVIVNDISKLLTESKVQKIYTNGKTAGKLYQKYMQDNICIPMAELPSTSPANAAFSKEKLVTVWRKIKEGLE